MNEWTSKLFNSSLLRASFLCSMTTWQNMSTCNPQSFVFWIQINWENSILSILKSNSWACERSIICLEWHGYGEGGRVGNHLFKEILGTDSHTFLLLFISLFFLMLVWSQICSVPDLIPQVSLSPPWVMLVHSLSTNDSPGMSVLNRYCPLFLPFFTSWAPHSSASAAITEVRLLLTLLSLLQL